MEQFEDKLGKTVSEIFGDASEIRIRLTQQGIMNLGELYAAVLALGARGSLDPPSDFSEIMDQAVTLLGPELSDYLAENIDDDPRLKHALVAGIGELAEKLEFDPKVFCRQFLAEIKLVSRGELEPLQKAFIDGLTRDWKFGAWPPGSADGADNQSPREKDKN